MSQRPVTASVQPSDPAAFSSEEPARPSGQAGPSPFEIGRDDVLAPTRARRRRRRSRGLWLLPVAALGLVAAVVLVAVDDGTGAPRRPGSGRSATSLPTAAPRQPDASEPLVEPPLEAEQRDGTFALRGFRLERPGRDGFFGATATVANVGDRRAEGVIRVELLKQGAVVGVVRGATNSVEPGQTVTVRLNSSDRFEDGIDGHRLVTEEVYPT